MAMAIWGARPCTIWPSRSVNTPGSGLVGHVVEERAEGGVRQLGGRVGDTLHQPLEIQLTREQATGAVDGLQRVPLLAHEPSRIADGLAELVHLLDCGGRGQGSDA